MARLSRDEYFMQIAQVVSKRSTCARRAVGCVVLDANGRILSTGHNGVPPKYPHCTREDPCAGASCPSGTGLDLCKATHAEINALLFCPDVMKVERIYTTTSPCMGCAKAIAATSCKEVVYGTPYPDGDDVHELLGRLGVVLRYHNEHRRDGD